MRVLSARMHEGDVAREIPLEVRISTPILPAVVTSFLDGSTGCPQGVVDEGQDFLRRGAQSHLKFVFGSTGEAVPSNGAVWLTSHA